MSLKIRLSSKEMMVCLLYATMHIEVNTTHIILRQKIDKSDLYNYSLDRGASHDYLRFDNISN